MKGDSAFYEKAMAAIADPYRLPILREISQKKVSFAAAMWSASAVYLNQLVPIISGYFHRADRSIAVNRAGISFSPLIRVTLKSSGSILVGSGIEALLT